MQDAMCRVECASTKHARAVCFDERHGGGEFPRAGSVSRATWQQVWESSFTALYRNRTDRATQELPLFFVTWKLNEPYTARTHPPYTHHLQRLTVSKGFSGHEIVRILGWRVFNLLNNIKTSRKAVFCILLTEEWIMWVINLLSLTR